MDNEVRRIRELYINAIWEYYIQEMGERFAGIHLIHAAHTQGRLANPVPLLVTIASDGVRAATGGSG